MLIGDIVTRNARRYPNDEAFVFEDKRLTWLQVNERVNALANALISLGLKKGDRVGFLTRNSHRLAEIYFSLAKAGLIAVPINTMLVGREVAHLLNDAGAKCLIAAEEYAATIDGIRGNLSGIEAFIGVGQKHDFQYEYEALTEEFPTHEPGIVISEDDWRAIKYTSGTTGLPKAYLVTYRQMHLAVMNLLTQLPHSQKDKCLLILSMAVGAGAHLIHAYSYAGCTSVIQGRFDPVAVLETIERERITTTNLAPTMIISLINHPDVKKYDLSSLRLMLYGGAPIAAPVLKQALATLDCGFCQVLAGSEVGGYIAYLMPEDHVLEGKTEEDVRRREARLASCGREALSADIRIVDESHAEVPVGNVGEVMARTESVVSGFWGPDGRCVSIQKDGWVATGDIARVDEEGYIYVVDRKKDVIISGAYNVYPAEVEAVLYAHPFVKEVAVIGVPDEKWGEAVKALLVLKDGVQCSEEEIMELCRANLAGYKRPKSVEFLEAFPKSSLGKILKRDLRAKYWKGQERQVH